MYKQNLHTHTTICDGKDSPEDIVKCAIELGFNSIGFSTHTPLPFDTGYPLPEIDFCDYKKRISRLKKEYEGIIDIYTGIEFDLYSKADLNGYDYIIGTTHYLKKDNEYIGIDRSLEAVKELIRTRYNGDGLALVKHYYQTLSDLPKYGKFDIVGHFDLISKNIEFEKIFDIESSAYKNYALDAIHTLHEKIKIFEVNTGAIARGYRTTPYPMPFILKELKKLGANITLSSDCHDKNYLDCYFNDAISYVKSCGFNKIYVLKGQEFVPEKI